MFARSLNLLAFCLVGAVSVAACGDSGTTAGGGGAGASGAGPSTGGGGAGGEGAQGGGVIPAGALTVLTWNLNNFYDTVEDPSSDTEDSLSQAAYDAKLAAAVAVIESFDPDVMILSEIEEPSILDDLNDALGGVYVERDLSVGNDPRGVDIGVVSKFAFSKIVYHADVNFTLQGEVAPTYRFARDAPEYHFTVGDQEVVLIGVHFRSKGPPDDPDKRLAEAQYVRAIANNLVNMNPDLAVGIMGDFNDLTGSPPFDAIAEGPPPFVDAAIHVPEEDRWTFNFMGNLELIDHMMLNPTLDGTLDTASVQIPHNGDVTNAGDHAPIVATFNLE
jgi:predicted extracellular nuclease